MTPDKARTHKDPKAQTKFALNQKATAQTKDALIQKAGHLCAKGAADVVETEKSFKKQDNHLCAGGATDVAETKTSFLCAVRATDIFGNMSRAMVS
jgi:hypothetical protein